MIEILDLEALQHHTLENHFRLPLEVKKYGIYVIGIGRKYNRIFNNKTLPDFIKSKLTIIKAIDGKYIEDAEVHPVGAYLYTGKDKDMAEIGWRVSTSLYIIIVNRDEYMQLRGEHDTRSKSKEASKESPRRNKLLSFLTFNRWLW